MKRVLIALFVLLGFVVGCEKEVIKEYPREGHREGYRHRESREYRLNDEAIQNGQTVQTEADIQE